MDRYSYEKDLANFEGIKSLFVLVMRNIAIAQSIHEVCLRVAYRAVGPKELKGLLYLLACVEYIFEVISRRFKLRILEMNCYQSRAPKDT